MKRAALVLVCAVAACANPGIVKMSGDTYFLSKTDRGGVFGNESALLADVLREASEFAESKNMALVPISLNQQPLQVGRSFASVHYQFMLVPKDDPRAKSNTLDFRPQQVIETRQR